MTDVVRWIQFVGWVERSAVTKIGKRWVSLAIYPPYEARLFQPVAAQPVGAHIPWRQ